MAYDMWLIESAAKQPPDCLLKSLLSMIYSANHKFLSVVVLLSSLHLPEAQTTVHSSPDKLLRAVIIPVGKKGYEGTESRIEIRSASSKTLRWKSFASYDGEHGMGVNHIEWTANSLFFVFNVESSGGHQPWRR